jgi:hypothetical protein
MCKINTRTAANPGNCQFNPAMPAATAALPSSCYNLGMRKLFCLLLLGLLNTSVALAADESAPAGASPEAVVQTPPAACDGAVQAISDCCHPIRVLQGCLKHKPLCEYPAHKCLTPCEPGAPCVKPPCVCHKPLTPCIPEDCAPCPPKACHKPLVVFTPEAVCAKPCEKCHARRHEACVTTESD